jgi:rubredoxin
MHSPAFVLREETVSDRGEKKQYSAKEGWMCPQCGKARAFRSHRKNLLEKLRSRFGRRYPFRCRACGHRFFKVIEQHTD